MKRLIAACLLASALSGCSGETITAPTTTTLPNRPIFGRGALAMSPEQEEDVPKELDADLLTGVQARAALPTSAMVSNLPPVANQGEVGSCAAFAAGYCTGTQSDARHRGLQPLAVSQQTSPAYLYRKVLQIENGKLDDGTLVVDYFRTLVAQGSPSNEEVPYPNPETTTKAQQLQSLGQIDLNAPRTFRFQAGSYGMLTSTGQELLDDIKRQIVQNHPVAFSMRLNPEFNDYTSGVFRFTQPLDKEGGHAMVIVGYDDTLGAFRIQNSWGTTQWGEQGLMWMAYDSWQQGFVDFQGECLVLHPVTVEAVSASGASLVANPAVSATGQISRSYQVGEPGATNLVLVYQFSEPVVLTQLRVTSPNNVSTTQSFDNLAARSGYLYFRRAEAQQFVAGNYQVALVTSGSTYTGTVSVPPLEGSTLPAADMDSVNETGSTGQALAP